MVIVHVGRGDADYPSAEVWLVHSDGFARTHSVLPAAGRRHPPSQAAVWIIIANAQAKSRRNMPG